MSKENAIRIQFFQLIAMGPVDIQICFKARFNNEDTNENFPKNEQKVFIEVLKEVLERSDYYSAQWANVGAACDLNELQKFANTNETIHNLEEIFEITVAGNDSNAHDGPC